MRKCKASYVFFLLTTCDTASFPGHWDPENDDACDKVADHSIFVYSSEHRPPCTDQVIQVKPPDSIYIGFQ